MARIVEKLKENNPDRVEPFKKDVQAAMKKVNLCSYYLVIGAYLVLGAYLVCYSVAIS